jgi:hypothetical protein
MIRNPDTLTVKVLRARIKELESKLLSERKNNTTNMYRAQRAINDANDDKRDALEQVRRLTELLRKRKARE